MSLFAMITALGWVGAVAGIVAYGMVSRGRWGAGTFAFQLTNLGAATAMLLVAAANGVWPSAAANLAWIIIGAHATVTIWHKRAEARAQVTVPEALKAPERAPQPVLDLTA